MLSTVVVDFEAVEDFGERARQEHVFDQPSDVLDYEWPTAPITFSIDGVYFIPPVYWLPLLWVARWATYEVERLQDVNQVELQLPDVGGIIRLTRVGNEVILVERVGYDKRAEVHYPTLLEAWEDCSKRIRNYLVEELPELANWPDFAPWFRGEKDWWVNFTRTKTEWTKGGEETGPGQSSE